MKIDKKIIKELSDYLDEFNLTELEYTEKDTKIKVSKNNISVNNQTISPKNENKLDNQSSKTKKSVNKSHFFQNILKILKANKVPIIL